MLIIAGHIRTKPELVEKLAVVLRSLVASSLKEDGCLDYAFALDSKEDGTVLVYERWRDQASLDAHLSQPQIKQLLGGWADKIEILVRKFDASKERGFAD